MSTKKVSFIETTSNNLKNLSLNPGRFIFTNDTRNLYLDLETTRATIGGVNIIETLATPSDWNEEDSNSISYIKNKPTSMPASDVFPWAKKSTKPSYTAAEVGADVAGAAQSVKTEVKEYTDNKISNLINGAPETLDTLKEVADAIAANNSVTSALNAAIGNKVDKIIGKGLSTKDFTADYETKLKSIATGAEVNVQADWNVLDTNSDAYIKNKPTSIKNPNSLNILLNGSSQGAYDGSTDKSINITADSIGAFPLYSNQKVNVTINDHLILDTYHFEVEEYYNEIDNNFDSVISADREKAEIRATNIEFKAQPEENANYGDINEWDNASLSMSVRGVKVFDFGNNQISYIRLIGNKSPSLMFKDTSTLSTPNHNIFLVNDFGGDYVDLGSNVQAPEYRMICGVNVKNAYLGEIDKDKLGLYSGGSFDLKAFKTGIAVVGDDKTTYIYSNTVKMGKVGNYFMVGATSSLYNHPDNYAYNVKFRNGKGVYLSLENEFTGGNSITINGDIKIVDENDVTSFNNNVTEEDRQWLTENTLQNMLIGFHKISPQSINALPLSGGTMNADASLNFHYEEPIGPDNDNGANYHIFDCSLSGDKGFVFSGHGSMVNKKISIFKDGITISDQYNEIYSRYDGNINFYRNYCSIINNGTRQGISIEIDKLAPYIYGNTPYLDLGANQNNMKWKNIYAQNGIIQTSDRTQKTNIVNLETELTKKIIMGLIPSSYEMIDGTSGRTHYGLIAQDVEELLNNLGLTSYDFAGFIKTPKVNIRYEDENGNKLKEPIEEIVEGEYNYSLRYDEFIAPLIKIVQEQQKTIEVQQAEIDQIKTLINY